MAQFDNVVLNPDITNGMKVKRPFKASITTTGSGGESRVGKWIRTRREYTLPFKNLVRSTYQAFQDFYDLRQGTVCSFLMWDPSDIYASLQDLGDGDGATLAFQLVRTKTDAAKTVSWPVLHPVPTGTGIPVQYIGTSGTGAATASMTITVGGVAKTEGTDYTVNALTGVVTFSVAPAAAAEILATYWYYTTVRYKEELELDFDSIFADGEIMLIECPLE